MQPFASDRYRVIAPLGGGGMAEVFLAVATGAGGFQKPVAIKRVLPHLAQNEDVARMFLAEARLATHLHHQNIVSVIDVGRGPEGLYLVMELVDGWDLGMVLGHEAKVRRWMPEPLALHVAQQVANGLLHAYRKTENGKPIMAAHRDLTPSNIMVTADGEVKIADFGIAKVDSGHTEPGTFKGKIPYAAPEVIRGEAATHLADQFSLGVVLHRITSGQYPYGYKDNVVAFHEMLARAGSPACPNLSEDCAAVVRRMLSLNPADRFPGIEEAAQAIGQLLAKAGAVAGAPQLARFVAGLKLPPPPSSKVPRELPPAVAAPPLASPAQDEAVNDWLPEGPQLDPSGRLTGAGRAAVPPSGGGHLSARFGGSPGAPPGEQAQRTPGQKPARKHSRGLSVSPAGDDPVITGRDDPTAQTYEPAPAPPQEQPEAPRLPGDAYDSLPGRYGPRPRRRVPVLLILLAGLVVGAGAAFFLVSPRTLRALLPAGVVPPRAQTMITILSEPSGAQVRIAGQAVGTTPLSQDNLYPPGVEVEVQVSLRGYKTWTGRIRGGETATLEANLRR